MPSSPEERQAKNAAKMQKHIEDVYTTSMVPRHGYFSYTAPNCCGDDSYAPRQVVRKARREGTGEEEQPALKGFLVGKGKKGNTKDAFFSVITPLAVGDPYVDPLKRQARRRLTPIDPDHRFKPGGNIRRSLNKLDFPYVYQGSTAPDPKDLYAKYKEYTVPRGVFTSPAKKGGGGTLVPGVLFSKLPEHVPEDYETRRWQRLAELKAQKEKTKDIPPFKSMCATGVNFTKNSDLYRHDEPCGIPRPYTEPHYPFTIKHDRPFIPVNPSKRGKLATLSKYPAYMESPAPPVQVRKRGVVEGEEAAGDVPPPWRSPHLQDYANPMPSVVLQKSNLRSESPHAFQRTSRF